MHSATNIPTPSGWTTLGDLTVGDRVFDDAGRSTIVAVVYDQPPGRDCLDVFYDGAKIVADAEHLWWTEDRAARVAQWPGRPERARRQRLDGPVVQRLKEAAAAATPDTTTIPEAAAFIGMDPTSRGCTGLRRRSTASSTNPMRSTTRTENKRSRRPRLSASSRVPRPSAACSRPSNGCGDSSHGDHKSSRCGSPPKSPSPKSPSKPASPESCSRRPPRSRSPTQPTREKASPTESPSPHRQPHLRHSKRIPHPNLLECSGRQRR